MDCFGRLHCQSGWRRLEKGAFKAEPGDAGLYAASAKNNRGSACRPYGFYFAGTAAGARFLYGAAAAQKAQQTINAAIPSLSPARPNAVPQGGLLTSIQNNNSSQNKGTHVENMNIHTAKPMTPLELENMMAMSVGG